MKPHDAAAVFAAFEAADTYESLMWRVDMSSADRDVRLLALCNDFFHYATADCEEIGAADIPMLESCLADLRETGDEHYLAELFAARKRKLRPLEAAGKDMGEATRALFDAAGTEEGRAEEDRKDAAFWGAVAHHVRSGREGAPT